MQDVFFWDILQERRSTDSVSYTHLFSAVSLMDLMFTAKDLIGLYYKTTEALFLLVVFYLIILLPVSILGSIVERRIRRAGFGD